ncbi:hypothetical protein BDL97_08G041000 [Sphagnum fallax]|nr:hypothetical protein BDL97_08G041000 [Sphagnum fallax]
MEDEGLSLVVQIPCPPTKPSHLLVYISLDHPAPMLLVALLL